jgi:hypothetical protein
MISETKKLSEKKLAEQALVELAFAQAEIALNGGKTATLARVLGHIRHAKSCLKALAPEYESPRGRARKAA